MERAEPPRQPADPCACGHPRNQHNRYDLGRCLAVGCRGCDHLTPPSS